MARRPLPHIATPGTSPTREVPSRSTIRGLLLSVRPSQWTKNLVVFAGLIFGGELFSGPSVARAGLAFLVFCALSGTVYLLNDLADREADRAHPIKARRPIASGEVTPATAAMAAALLGASALSAAYWLGADFGLIALAYVGLLVAYSHALKHLVIIDVLSISAGFVLRAVAGAVVIAVPISHWLLVCTILLALFLSLSKRRHELVLLEGSAGGHRPILEEYSPYLLDQMIAVVTASTIMAYAFYTISSETIAKFETDLLGWTLPFPLYGIFRYLYLVHRKEGGGNPSATLVTDRPLMICVLLWVLVVVILVYRPLGP